MEANSHSKISDDLLQQVRSGDYDRFLAVQLAPAQKRAAMIAVVAFAIELARVAEVVSEPLIGHIRLAWWREALEEIAAGQTPRNHPTVLALAEIYRESPQIFPLLQEMIEARAADLDTSLIALEAEWRRYCDRTSGALHLALAMMLDRDLAREHAVAIRQQGTVYAMVGLLRAIPFMTSRGWLRFPHDRLNAQGIISLESSAALPVFVERVVADGLVLHEAGALPRALRPLRALRSLTQLHAKQLAKVGYDPYRLRPGKLAAVWCVLIC